MRRQKKTMIWPVYLDSSKTRRDGRKIPKSIGISAPTLVEIQRAAQNLGLTPEIVIDSAYPKTPWKKSGRVWIASSGSRTQMFKDIVKEIVDLRQKSKGS